MNPTNVTYAVPAEFKRRFGPVLHYAWMHTDSADIENALREQVFEPGVRLFEKNGAPDGLFTAYRSLCHMGTQGAILWLERYPDLHAWARTETVAQTTPEWFASLRPLFLEHDLKFGRSQIMVEDSTHGASVYGPRAQGSGVHWIAFRAPLAHNLLVLPQLAAELADEFARAGLEADVHCLGMPTSAAEDRNLGHLWVECKDTASLVEAVLFQERAVASWRRRFLSSIESVAWRHLLVKTI